MKTFTLSQFVLAWEASARISTSMLQAMQLAARGRMTEANMAATLTQIENDVRKITGFLNQMKME